MKISQKLSIRLILFQVLAIHLLGITFFRFYYFLNADLCECIFHSPIELAYQCLAPHPDLRIGDLIAGPTHCMLYGFLFGIVVVSIFNGIKKKSILNTVLVAVLFVILFLIGTFSSGYLDSWIFSLARFFSKKIDMSNLIASLIAFSMALLLVWVSVLNKLLSKTETAHV